MSAVSVSTDLIRSATAVNSATIKYTSTDILYVKWVGFHSQNELCLTVHNSLAHISHYDWLRYMHEGGQKQNFVSVIHNHGLTKPLKKES